MIKNTPYVRFDNRNLILRDELAIDRTLANERTLLSTIQGRAGDCWSYDHEFITGSLVLAGQDACLPIGILTGLSVLSAISV